MFGKLLHQLKLLSSELKRVANVHLVVNACTVEYLHELLANIIQNGMIVSHANHMTNPSLAKKFSSRFWMAAGHKNQFKFGFDFPKNFPYGLRIHFDTFTDVIFKKEIVLLFLYSMPTKVQDFNWLVHPIMKFIHGGSFSNVIDLALYFFEQLLDNVFLLKIINLLFDLLTVDIEHWLAVQKQKRSRTWFTIVFLAFVSLKVLHKHFAKWVVINSELQSGKHAHVKRVQSKTVVHRGW